VTGYGGSAEVRPGRTKADKSFTVHQFDAII